MILRRTRFVKECEKEYNMVYNSDAWVMGDWIEIPANKKSDAFMMLTLFVKCKAIIVRFPNVSSIVVIISFLCLCNKTINGYMYIYGMFSLVLWREGVAAGAKNGHRAIQGAPGHIWRMRAGKEFCWFLMRQTGWQPRRWSDGQVPKFQGAAHPSRWLGGVAASMAVLGHVVDSMGA